jgi:cationic peptide transport system ATP-binding protein
MYNLPLLEVKHLYSTYTVEHMFVFHKKVNALSDVNFTLYKGQTLAITGDAGSGKSTLLKILNGQDKQQSGEVLVYGKPIDNYERKDRVRFVRLLYPHPETSINPHIKIKAILDSPLLLNTNLSERERNQKINKILEYVGLQPDFKHYYPSMITGNQRLRLSLARALILEPEILLVDASIEKLDPQLRSHFLNIFLDRQEKKGTSIIICMNDLGLIKHIADKVLVLNHGMQEDYGTSAQVFIQPQSDMTRRLLQSYNHEYRCVSRK